MKALVVGGTGPTGPHVVQGLLNKGHKVAILHRGTHEANLSSESRFIGTHGDPHFPESPEQTIGPD